MKNIRVFLSENFHFLDLKFSVHLNRRFFVMENFVPELPTEWVDAQADLSLRCSHKENFVPELPTEWVDAQADLSLRCSHKENFVPELPTEWVDAQADLSLRWAHIPFCWFCLVLAHNIVCLHTLVFLFSFKGIQSDTVSNALISYVLLGKR